MSNTYDSNPFPAGYPAQQMAGGSSGPSVGQKPPPQMPPPSMPPVGQMAPPAQPQASSQPLPSYLQQQNNPSFAGAANNIVRALMAGRDQANNAPAGGPGMNTASPLAGRPSGTFSGASVPYAGAGPWGIGPSQQDNTLMSAMMSQPPSQ